MSPIALGALDWQDAPASWGLDYGKYADLLEMGGAVVWRAVIDVNLDDDCRASIALGDPTANAWSRSTSSADWPVLDGEFGRHIWRAYLDGYAAAVRADVEGADQ